MTTLTDLQKAALNIIASRGRGNPITGKEIATAIKLKPRDTGKEGADLRSIINALRRKGYPICASGQGYWYPMSTRELDEYIESFEARINDQMKALAGMRSAGREHIGYEPDITPEPPKPERYEVLDPSGTSVKVWTVAADRKELFLKTYPNAKLLREVVVPSTSKKGKRYVVKEVAGGGYTCECDGFRFSTTKTCKHVHAAKVKVGQDNIKHFGMDD